MLLSLPLFSVSPFICHPFFLGFLVRQNHPKKKKHLHGCCCCHVLAAALLKSRNRPIFQNRLYRNWWPQKQHSPAAGAYPTKWIRMDSISINSAQKTTGKRRLLFFSFFFFTWPKKAASRFELAADEKGEIDAICRTVFSHGIFSQKCLWFCCMGRIGESFPK